MTISRRSQLLIAVPALAFLMGAGCSRSQVLTTLAAIVSTIEISLPSIAAAGGTPPETIEAIQRYLQGVSKATAAASDILAGVGTPAEKAARITQAFAGIAAGCNCIKAGTPQRIISLVDLVAQAVLRFLTTIKGPGAEGVSRGLAPGSAEVNAGEKKELSALRVRSLAIIGAIELERGKK